MSYSDQQSGPYPGPRNMREAGQSAYPPLPGEDDDRSGAYHQRGQSSGGTVTLPPISPYEYPQQNAYPADPRDYQQYGPPQQRGGGPQWYSEPPRGPPQHMAFTQSAPRQRTAIACRYCRRRKIRCSGFDQHPNGRCSNCQRFQQECVFTPVSSQAQAFVPAHAVYPHMRNGGIGLDGRPRLMVPDGQQLYGAHGQPLGPIPAPISGPSQGYSEYSMPSPTGSYNSFIEDRGDSRKRPQGEPQGPILPPPMPGQQAYPRNDGGRRQAVEDEMRLPPVTPNNGPQANSNYSPGSSTGSTSGLRPPQDVLPSISRNSPSRSSPAERNDPMALGNIMDQRGEDIDRNMLGRLDRKKA